VAVICEEPFRYLFEDFAHEFETYPVQHVLRDRWTYKGKLSFDLKAIVAKYPGARWFDPNEDRCKRKEAKWFMYGNNPVGEETLGLPMDILIHARNLPKVYYDKQHGNRNWPDKKWEALIQNFKHYSIGYVGSYEGAKAYFMPPDYSVMDYRGIGLGVLCNIMAKSKVIVGPSSGPLHLAALCGCPIVVWSHRHKEKSLGGHTNRDRYERLLNPFCTAVTVLDKWGWDVPVDRVVEAIGRYL
jgi:hypothetical protein